MRSKARKTGDTFDAQDPIGRAYKSEDPPQREKERLADVWICEDDTKKTQPLTIANYSSNRRKKPLDLIKISKTLNVVHIPKHKD